VNPAPKDAWQSQACLEPRWELAREPSNNTPSKPTGDK
jgi:hypothetical protein